MYLRVLFLILILFPSILLGQKTSKLKLKKFRVTYLDAELLETSGLCFLNDKLYTFNDGGNPNKIFELNPENGQINKSLSLNFSNTDWEAVTTNGKDLFIGDFGNNSGSRKDLTIFQLQIKNDSVKTVTKIPFGFLNQIHFNSNNLNHDFDAEALIFDNNQLHLFSKEWKSKKTSHYVIDFKNETQKLSPIENYKTKFCTTDACFFKNKLYLIGYTKKGRCFLQIFEKNQNGLFFNKPLQKYRLGSVLTIGQIEGITANEKGIYISAEGFQKSILKVKPALYFIPISFLE